ncbi:MAG: hypothetical protein JSS81_20340 [Acidobacteria bacterium]|nr:hypothetical protein [Acidobacteriota bacterium]
MEVQNVIVGVILLAAIVYAGNQVRLKVKALGSKSKSCDLNCGCDRK